MTYRHANYGLKTAIVAIAVIAASIYFDSWLDAQDGFRWSDSYHGPVTIEMQTEELNSPFNKYGPVEFPHRRHAERARDCTVCHHHFDEHKKIAIETGANYKQRETCIACHTRQSPYSDYQAIRCSVCHETGDSRSNLEIVGLKGAFHRLCIGCHTKSEKGPTGCTACHKKTL